MTMKKQWEILCLIGSALTWNKGIKFMKGRQNAEFVTKKNIPA